jgi:hypothetical protein
MMIMVSDANSNNNNSVLLLKCLTTPKSQLQAGTEEKKTLI